MLKTEQQQESSRLLTSQHVGSHGWWLKVAQRGTPWMEPLNNGRWQVTFFWRDPQGCELTSRYQRVWIYINGLTDHHQASPPQSLQRLKGSDVWYWQTELKGDWRGSYCFIPCINDHFNEQLTENSPVTGQEWRRVLSDATHDLLNPNRTWQSASGHYLSGLHMPLAPPQPAWRDFDHHAVASGRCTPAPPAKLQKHIWHSQRLGTTRPVWIYSTGENHPATRPLAILLDGQFWAQHMPIWQPLMKLTREGQLPQAVYLLIDVIDQTHRAQELTCNPQFWLALQEELLPQLARYAEHCDAAASTVVVGQSFGGLSALYAGLSWPEHFGAIISQSGSFWWPRRDILHRKTWPDDACWLMHHVNAEQLGTHGKLKIFLEVGRHEKLNHQVNDCMADLLCEQGHQVQYRVVEGGHDALCWRGGLFDGLQAHWGDQRFKTLPYAKGTPNGKR